MLASPEMIVKLIEKSVDLLRLKKEDKRKFFQEVIAPAFAETQPVVEDYHRLWRDVMPIATEMARSPSIDPAAEAAMREQLDNQRQKCYIARRKLHGVAKRLERSDDIAVQEFGRRINEIFDFQNETCAGTMSGFGMFCELNLRNPELDLGWYQGRLRLALDTIAEKRRAVEIAWIRLAELHTDLQMRAYGR
jgi:hypothetical protein